MGETTEGRDASDLLTGHDLEDWTDIAFLRGTVSQKWLCAVTARFKIVYSPEDRPWLFDLKLDPGYPIWFPQR